MGAALVMMVQGNEFQSPIESLGSESIEVRERVTAELAATGDRAIPSLIKAQGSTDLEVSTRVLGLLQRSASSRLPSTLGLSCDEPNLGSNSTLRIVLHVKNEGKLPALIYTAGLHAVGLATMSPIPGRFEWLEPGECLHVELEGTQVFKDLALRPLYCDPSERLRSAPTTIVLQVRKEDLEEIAGLLHDLFKRVSMPFSSTVDIAVDLRTNSIVVRGSNEEVEMAKKSVNELDPAQRETVSTYVFALRCGRPAADLSKDLEKLLRGVSGSKP